MRKFRLYTCLLWLCGFCIACNHSDETSLNKETQLKSSQSALIDQLNNDTELSDSIKEGIKTLITDSMRWWGIDKLTNNLDSIHQRHQQQLNLAKIAADWSQKHHCNDFVKGRIWNQKGLHYANVYAYDSAFFCFKQALKLFNTSKCYNELSTTNINLAGIYYRTGFITTAAEYYKRASLLADSLGNTQNCISSNIALAQIYADLKNFRMAQQHLDEAELLIDEANIYELYFYYFARGICYYYQKEHDRAYAALSEALIYAKELGLFQQTICQASLAEASLLTHNKDLAMSHILPCLEVLDQYPHTLFPTVKFYIYSIAANVYLEQGNKKMAQKFLDEMPKDDDVVMLRYLFFHYNRMAKYAEKDRDYKKAFDYLKIANKYQDQLDNENAMNNLIEIGQRYQRDTTALRQNMVIAKIENKMAQRQLDLTIVITGLLLIISAFIVTFVIVRRNNEKRYHEQFKKISKLRMDVVRNRMSPHYIFNVLAMMLPKFKSNPELHQLSELFIDVIRGNLLASNELSVKLSDEVRLVKQYVSLYHMSNSPYPEVIWHDTTDEATQDIMVPTMCLQIPVENALKHAFPKLNEHSRIEIFLTAENHRLSLRIVDNGQGYHPERVTPTGRDTGTGIRVLTRSISLFNKHNTNPIEFHIGNLQEKNSRGTEVNISIPFDFIYTE